MDAAIKSIAWILGTTVGSTALIIIAISTARSALGKAIEQFAARELEKYRSDLAKDLERERQAFALDLERQRSAAAVELEKFKTELTSGAEMRRLVAARRLDVLLAVWNNLEPLMRNAMNASPTDANARAAFVSQLMGYIETVRDGAVFFTESLQDALHTYVASLNRLQSKWFSGDDNAFEEASAARAAMVARFRTEFGIV